MAALEEEIATLKERSAAISATISEASQGRTESPTRIIHQVWSKAENTPANTALPTQSSRLTAALGTSLARATSAEVFFAYRASVASCAFLRPSSPWTRRVSSSASAF